MDDEDLEFLFFTSSPYAEAWRKALGVISLPRFPLDAEVAVGCKMLDNAGKRFELTLTDDGAHTVHRCPVHLDNITDELYILGIIGRFQ